MFNFKARIITLLAILGPQSWEANWFSAGLWVNRWQPIFLSTPLHPSFVRFALHTVWKTSSSLSGREAETLSSSRSSTHFISSSSPVASAQHHPKHSPSPPSALLSSSPLWFSASVIFLGGFIEEGEVDGVAFPAHCLTPTQPRPAPPAGSQQLAHTGRVTGSSGGFDATAALLKLFVLHPSTFYFFRVSFFFFIPPHLLPSTCKTLRNMRHLCQF